MSLESTYKGTTFCLFAIQYWYNIFSTKANPKTHQKHVDAWEKPCSCKECGKCFSYYLRVCHLYQCYKWLVKSFMPYSVFYNWFSFDFVSNSSEACFLVRENPISTYMSARFIWCTAEISGTAQQQVLAQAEIF